MIKISEMNLVRIISFTLAVVLVLVGFVIKENREKNYYITRSKYVLEKSLEDLSSSLNGISVALKKATYTTDTSMLCSLAAQLWKESGTAKAALSSLPNGESELTSVNKLISQVGDYSLYIAKKKINGDEITEEEKENLEKLSSIAETVANKAGELMILYGDGYFEAELVSSLDADYISSFGASLTEIEDTLTDYPTLIYDGPYSDHVLTDKPKLLEVAEQIPVDDAYDTAFRLTGIDKDKLPSIYASDGNMPCYCFTNDSFDLEITKQGGYVASYRKYRTVEKVKLDYDKAVEIAGNYLARGGESFEPTYYFADEGVCVVSFAYVEGGIIYYADLVKIGVALDTGEIVQIEASGYICNHTKREITAPLCTVDAAGEKIDDGLKITSVRLAVIPTSKGNEKLCYEFKVSSSPYDVIYYIDADNLVVRDLLIVLATDGGTLVK